MADKPYGDYWDRSDLLEEVKSLYQKLHGTRPEVGLFDDLEIKSLNEELADLRGEIIKKNL